MARSVPEWIGKSHDSKVPDRVRLRIFGRFDGICQLSKRKIAPGEAWELHHVKGLEEGGEHRESNLVPVLVDPHRAETKKQRKVKKKIDRTKKKHLGMKPKTSNKADPARTKIDKSALPSLPPRRLYR